MPQAPSPNAPIRVISKPGDFKVVNKQDVTQIIHSGQPGPVGQTNPVEYSIDWSTWVNVDWQAGDIAVIRLFGDIANLSMSGTRKKGLLVLIQDSVGGRTVTFDPGSIGFGLDIPSVELSTDPDLVDYIGFQKNPLTGKFDVVAFARGYS